jgi:serine/threonine protein kinase
LNYCHENKVIHRDLKPENVFISKVNDKLLVQIADFGLSKNVEASIAKSIVGSMNFMAPELFENDNYDYSVDIWSFGVIFFLVLNQYAQKSTSRNYFDFKLSKNRDSIAEYLKEFNYFCHQDYISIIQKCVSIDPTKRPNVKELLEVLTNIEKTLKSRGLLENPQRNSIEINISSEVSNTSNPNDEVSDNTMSQSDLDNSMDLRTENDIVSFLNSLSLSQYTDAFLSKGYDDLDFIKEYGLTDEDFEQIGISLPGHKRKLKIKIEELKNNSMK